MVNFLYQKREKTVDEIALLAATIESNCKKYSNVAITVASLKSKLGANKNLMESVWEKSCMECLLRQ